MIWAEEERKLQEERAIMLQEHDNPIEPHMVERWEHLSQHGYTAKCTKCR